MEEFRKASKELQEELYKVTLKPLIEKIIIPICNFLNKILK